MPTTGNRFLDALPGPACTAMLSASTRLNLPIHASLYQADTSPAFMFFLTSGVASLVVNMSDGGSSETGMIGCEGIIGSEALLGSERLAAECFMQVSGQGYRVPTSHVRRLFDGHFEVRATVLSFVLSQMILTVQFAACNRLHQAEGRLARWLLICSDLNHSDRMDLTQEFLAQMLGTQRTTIALLAGVMQRDGLISYRRGNLQILNRAGLTEVACSCYRVSQRIVAGLYGGFTRTSQ